MASATQLNIKWCLILWILSACTFRYGAAVMNNVNAERVSVTTTLGRVIGTVETSGIQDGSMLSMSNGGRGKKFYSFKGIPYAKPPVAHLRWKDPVPYGPWTMDLDGKNFGSICPQFDRVTSQVIGDENCLFLNVFTPAREPIRPARSNQNLSEDDEEIDAKLRHLPADLMPVMVWFHGGGYVRGGSSQFGPQFLMREGHDVVLVTVNYRLGVFGFLSTGDRNLPGNYGMLDQIEALRWIRSQISNFGGDPARITIFGESAGASITHLLTLSPLGTGLFRQTIMQSSSGLCDWSVELHPMEYARSIAAGLNCPRQPSIALVGCLKNRTAQQLIGLQTEHFKYSLFPIRLAPVVDAGTRDQPFLPELPLDIILNRNYRPVPMMIGLNPNEGLLFYLWIHTENGIKMTSRSFLERELVPGVLESILKNQTQVDAVFDVVKRQYFGDTDFGDAKTFVPRFSQMMEDSIFTSCIYRAQKLMSTSAHIYAYLFSYKGQETPSYSMAFANLVKQSGFDHPLINTGVTHGDELLYLFRMAGTNAAYSSQDMKVSQMMTTLWTNFAKTGDPVKGSVAHPIGIPHWPRVSAFDDSVIYLNIDAQGGNNLGVDFRKAEYNFWSNVVPHVRIKSAASQEENISSLTAVWALLSLFLLATATIAALIIGIIFQQRRRRYPARPGVVLEHTATT